MQPAEGIRFIHIAICREAGEIEEQAAAAESPAELAALGTRVARFARINKLHTDGEEASIYPELEGRLRHVGAAYLYDHRDDQALFADLSARIEAATQATAATRGDLLRAVRRQSIALTEHVLPHVRKEDGLIVPLITELFSPAEQGAQIGKMMAGFSPQDLAQVLPWLVAHCDLEDRLAYLQMLERVMPPERFTVACGWIRAGVTTDLWTELVARMPTLA